MVTNRHHKYVIVAKTAKKHIRYLQRYLRLNFQSRRGFPYIVCNVHVQERQFLRGRCLGLSVPTTQSAVIERQSTIPRSPPPPKILRQKPKGTTKVTLYESPINPIIKCEERFATNLCMFVIITVFEYIVIGIHKTPC